MESYFGSHESIGDGLINAAKTVKKAGGNMLQIFLTNPRKKLTKRRNNKKLIEFNKYLKDNDMKVVVHSSYLHNLSRDWDEYSWWLTNLELEIKYAHYIGAIGLVLHFGKKLDLTLAEAYNNMYTSLVYIHKKTRNYNNVKILLETPAGQGSEICYKLEDLVHFYKKFSRSENKELRDRIKLCVDTCHIFSAGYDLRNNITVKMYLEAFEELIGLNHIKLIHLNDSKVELGDRKDRHENIGKGFIGFKGLKYFFDYFYKKGVPIVLETPNEGHKWEIKKLLK